MPFEQRIRYEAFIENQKEIEHNWNHDFGDRKNELVVIGQHLDKEEITKDLNSCLCNNEELEIWKSGMTFEDPWPIDE